MNLENDIPPINWNRGLEPPSGRSGNIDSPFDTWVEAQGGGGAPPVDHPFKLSLVTVGGSTEVKIRFGMVNEVTPGGMGDNTEPDLLLPVNSGYVILAVTTDTNGIAQSAAISIAATMPGDTGTLGHIALGLITLDGGTYSINQSVSGSLWHQKCGTTIHLFGSV